MTYVRRKSPLDNLQTDWLSLHDEIDRAHQAERDSTALSAQIQAENGILMEQLDRATTELGYWRAYALEMETRLDVIGGVISEAQTRARSRARGEVAQQTQTEPQIPFAPDRTALRAAPAPDEDDGPASPMAGSPLPPVQYQ
jgi:hypothetical protein